MAAKRMELLVDERTDARLTALEAKLELKRPDLIRQAIKRMAEQEEVERHDSDSA